MDQQPVCQPKQTCHPMKPIVFGHTQGLDVQASTVASPTIRANGNGLAVLVFAPGAMIRMGGNVWEGIMPTLRAELHGGDNTPHVLIIDPTRVDDVRVYEDGITPCLKNRMGTGGNNVPMIQQETTHDVVGTLQARYRKGANHESARDGQLVIGEVIVRRLTPVECERLMGWPDNHTLHRADGRTNADSTRYKMCGNGVASPVAEWIGGQILAWEGSETAL